MLNNFPGQPVPEEEGYLCQPGHVKARFENNRFYVDQFADTQYYMALLRLVQSFAFLCKRVNIAQIGWEFGAMTCEYQIPEDLDLNADCPAWIKTVEQLKQQLDLEVAYAAGWCLGYDDAVELNAVEVAE